MVEKLTPIGKRLLIEETIIENKTKSGFILPEEDKPKTGPTKGVIIEVGKTEDKSLEPGMRVLFNKFSPVSVYWQGSTYLLVNENDILMAYPNN